MNMPVFALQRKNVFTFEQIDAIQFAEIWNKLDISRKYMLFLRLQHQCEVLLKKLITCGVLTKAT